MLRRLRELWGRRASKIEADRLIASLHDMWIVDMRDPDTRGVVRRLNEETIYQLLGRQLAGASRVALERELRRREGVPTRRLAFAALIISVASLIVSLAKLVIDS